MSLLKLSSLPDNAWYLPRDTYPYGKEGYKTKKFSPSEKVIRKCREINFFQVELPIIQHNKYNMWKYFEKGYIYSQIVDILLSKRASTFHRMPCIRRVRGLR